MAMPNQFTAPTQEYGGGMRPLNPDMRVKFELTIVSYR